MKIKNFILITLLGSLIACSNGPHKNLINNRHPVSNLDISCAGPETANKFVIYLHGMDSAKPSKQELRNRIVLNKIAQTLNIRFALHRAYTQCPTQTESICWGWKFDQAELDAVLPLIMEARLKCFTSDRPFGVIGFSNGGNLLMKWYVSGIFSETFPTPSFIITSGSGNAQIPTQVNNLASNPKIAIVIGKDDQYNLAPSKLLFQNLQKIKAPIELYEFDGGHELDQNTLLKLFQNF